MPSFAAGLLGVAVRVRRDRPGGVVWASAECMVLLKSADRNSNEMPSRRSRRDQTMTHTHEYDHEHQGQIAMAMGGIGVVLAQTLIEIDKSGQARKSCVGTL
jgi:hypothetical protein